MVNELDLCGCALCLHRAEASPCSCALCVATPDDLARAQLYLDAQPSLPPPTTPDPPVLDFDITDGGGI